MSLWIKAGIMVTNNLNNQMQNKQKIINLVFIRIVWINIEAAEESKSEQTFETLCMVPKRPLSLAIQKMRIEILALTKLVFICSVMNKLNDFIKQVNRITFDFIWNHKPSKIKKAWTWKTSFPSRRRVKLERDALWQRISKSLQAKVGGKELQLV